MPLDSAPLSGTVYIPDTSSLVENPDALDRLLTDGNVVVLLHQVIEELGRLQASRNKSDGVRAAARTVTRKILSHRENGRIRHDLTNLLQLPPGSQDDGDGDRRGVLAWEPEGTTLPPFDDSSGDNLIVAGARRVTELAREEARGRYRIVVVSEDSNMLLKCDALGLEGENLRYGKIELRSPDQIYRGHVTVDVDPEVLDDFHDSGNPHERFVPLSILSPELREQVFWNTGVILRSGDRTLLTPVFQNTCSCSSGERIAG